MKQPKVILFDREYDVLGLRFCETNGKLESIRYKSDRGWGKMIFQGDVIVPITDSQQDIVIVPSLDEILILE